jgi:hypothetical protein
MDLTFAKILAEIESTPSSENSTATAWEDPEEQPENYVK